MSFANLHQDDPDDCASGIVGDGDTAFYTDIPQRLDRLPWSSWHLFVSVTLGFTCVLNGLEVTIVGSLGSVLQSPETLGLSDTMIGLSGSMYIAGSIFGAILFGYLTDEYGRKRLFIITMLLYIFGAVLCGLAWDAVSFCGFRFVTGMAVGGEGSAVQSAVDELIPAMYRGRVNLAMGGSFWLGAAIGAVLSIFLLNPSLVPLWLGWPLCFLGGAVMAMGTILGRRYVPESPRWLLTHGQPEEAETVMKHIEDKVGNCEGCLEPLPKMEIRPSQKRVTFFTVGRILFVQYWRQTVVGLTLMLTQAFFYNAIFFTYSLVLTKFYAVSPSRVGLFLFPFAVGNFLGPFLLGRYFDVVGRRVMISATYILSGVLILITGLLFLSGVLTAVTQSILWSITFFAASPAAGGAYLTVSEVFPLELRAMAIAFFYTVGTAAGGLLAPLFFGELIATEKASNVMVGYAVGAGLMIAGGVVEAFLGVDAEGRSLESLAPPLSAGDTELRPM
eukprot:EG_transcript_8915